MHYNKKHYKTTCLIILFLLYPAILYGEDWWHVYFTSPNAKEAVSYKKENPENALVRNIKSAKKRAYRVYNLQKPCFARKK